MNPRVKPRVRCLRVQKTYAMVSGHGQDRSGYLSSSLLLITGKKSQGDGKEEKYPIK